MTSGITTKLTVISAAVAASLVFTFSAFAATRPDDRAGVHGPGAAVAAQVGGDDPGLAPRPDNRAGVLGIGSDESTSAAATSSGFDWTAAGLGAGATGAVILLVGAAAMLAMPRRQRAVA
jgi:hypothetical protein